MGAQLEALGRTRVTSAGTPVAIAASIPASINPQTAHAIIIEALPTNVGKVYIGKSTLNKSTFVGVLVVLPTPTANSIPTFSLAVTQAANAIKLSDFYIDADNANDGVIVTALIA